MGALLRRPLLLERAPRCPGRASTAATRSWFRQDITGDAHGAVPDLCPGGTDGLRHTAIVTIVVSDTSADMISAITAPVAAPAARSRAALSVPTTDRQRRPTPLRASGAGVSTGACTASAGSAASPPVGATLTRRGHHRDVPGTVGGSDTPETAAVAITGTTGQATRR